MTNVLKKHWLIFLGAIIQISFFISAFWTHWYDVFFFGSSIHYCCKGLDFYQIPNAAFAFMNGGKLTGELTSGITQYSGNYFSNMNVYHPLLTIFIGTPLLIFPPAVSFYVWMFLKLIIVLLITLYIYKKFKKNKHINLSLFLFLTNFSQYNEVVISQYQFLFNIFFLFFLISLTSHEMYFKSGILFFLTLLVKPIGILWIPVLIIKRFSKVAITGILLFLFFTAMFLTNNMGFYYTNNLTSHFFHPIRTNTIDIMSLDALLRYTFPDGAFVFPIIKYLTLGVIYLLAFSKRVSILKLIFLLTVYFLFFYDLVYQYHFSVLGPLLCICLLFLPEFQTKISKTIMVLVSLPSVFFILRILNIGVYHNSFLGTDPTFLGWQITSSFQIAFIFLLIISVVTPDIIHFLRKIKKHYAI